MKKTLQFLLAGALCLSVQAFAEWGDTVSIGSVKHWDADDREVHVRGTISDNFGSDGILLSDDTGEIYVHFTNNALRDYRFHSGMRVEVRGVVHRNHYYWHDHHHWDHHHWDLDANAIKIHDGDGLIVGY